MRDDREVWLEEHDAALVAATRRQCAQAMCYACRVGSPKVEPGWAHGPEDFFHLDQSANGYSRCPASAIWALADREPE